MQGFELRFADAVIKMRWLIIALCLFAVFAMASGGRYLYMDSDYRLWFDGDNPELEAFESIERIYTKTDNVLFVIAPKDGDVFTEATLSMVKELTEQAWQIPYSGRVDSITNFQHTEADADDLVVRDLVMDDFSAGELQRVKHIALNEPLLVDRLIARDGRVTAINVRTPYPGIDKTKEIPEVANAVNALGEEFRKRYPDIDLYLSGSLMLSANFSLAAQGDAQTLLPISFVLMGIILLLLLRSFSGAASILFVVICSIAAAMGARGYSGFSLSPLSGGTPIIVLTVAIANCVHVTVSFVNELGAGKEKLVAIREALRVNLQPVILASVTTTVGFLTLNASDAPPIRYMGNTVAVGVMVSLVMSLTFLPAVLSILPARARRGAGGDGGWLEGLGRFVVARRTAIFFAMLAVIVGLSAMIPRNELNEDALRYFDETFAFRRAVDFSEANLTGPYTVDYSVEAGSAGGVAAPEFLRDVARFAEWLRAQPEVRHVSTLTDIIKRLNKNLHADDPGAYRLPDDQELTAQYLLLYEMSLPYGLDLNDQINIDKSSIRLTGTIQSLTMRGLLDYEARVQAWVADNTPALTITPGVGSTFMFAHVTQRNARNLLFSTTVALVLISFILVLAFKSVKFGVASLIPNLVPAAMGFGVWGLADGNVGLDIAPVMGMTLGIVIDDTVHFMSKYLRGRREMGSSSSESIIYTFRTVGRALLVTSCVLVVGFLVLACSHFGLNARMSALTVMVIIFALVADFLFLPAILMGIDRKKSLQTNA
jgi:predicted RND superfamily exporter protein